MLDALEALSARQKEALWRGFLQDGTQPMEFQWLWDAYREGAVGSLLEWELTLQLTPVSYTHLNRIPAGLFNLFICRCNP